MSFRFDEPDEPKQEQPSAVAVDRAGLTEPEPLTPEVQREVDRLDEVEAGYAKYLDGGLSPSMTSAVAMQQDRIQAEHPDADVAQLKQAWAEARADEPQPEDHKFNDKLQLEYAQAKNIAFARELDAARQREPAPNPAPEPISAPSAPRAMPAPTPTPEIVRQEEPKAPSLKPLTIEDLREKAQQTPEIQRRVEAQKDALRALPELQTPEGRAASLASTQAQMERAALESDKLLERRLRIRLLALDELAREPIAPRPLPEPSAPIVVAPEPAPVVPPRPQVTAADIRPLPMPSIEKTQPEAVNPTPDRFVVAAPSAPEPILTVATPRPLPTPSLEDTEPGGTPVAPARFAIGDDQPTLNAPQREAPALSQEAPPIHRRSDLGLPPPPPSLDELTIKQPQAPALDDPTVKQAPAFDDDATLRPTAPSPLPELSKEAPPIHRLTDLKVDREPNPLEEDLSGEGTPAMTPSALAPDISTRPGRNRAAPPPKQPEFEVPEATQEIGIGDIEVDVELELDSQERFNTHVKQQLQLRDLGNAVREDVGRFERLRERADGGDPNAQDLVKTVNERIASFKTVGDNADAIRLTRQHAALTMDEKRPERTANVHIADRYALAVMRDESLVRSKHLANAIAGDYLNEIKALPAWDRDDIKREAALLMATQERAYEEYPFNDRVYLRQELISQHEANPEYGRLCALMLKANEVPTNMLAYTVERDPVLYKQAQDRATTLLERDATKTDDMLQRELAEAKLEAVFAEQQGNAEALRAAHVRAGQIVVIYEALPTRRALEVDTGPMRRRPS